MESKKPKTFNSESNRNTRSEPSRTARSEPSRTARSEPSRTGWGKVAGWYNELVEERPGNYQTSVILPNLQRILDIQKNTVIADLACGQGFFAREFAKSGARVFASDIAEELIALAVKNTPPALENKITYKVSPADKLGFIANSSVDKAVIIFAIQNIENVKEVLTEVSRILKPNGKLVIAMNHPAFRIPKGSDWGWDEKTKVQYRRINQYITESKIKIQMHPGDKPSEHTLSFHRPLQFYFKALQKSGFCVARLEEWTSHKKSEPGPRAEIEDRARKEIPLFLCLEAVKHQ